MANELLDFVMSLVRDPDAAARYAGNPEQAIADAHLSHVTSVDVNNLIPVVSESMSMATPAYGTESAGHANVWASGAATAAFDAFSEHLPAPGAQPVVETHAGVPDQPTVAPPDSSVDVFGDPGAHLSALDQPLTAPDIGVHDVAGAAEPAAFDSGFDHLGDHHFSDHLSDHQGYGEPGAGHDPHGFDAPLI
ncbi:MAG: Rv0340 family protein [Mycobacteriaceae bacterium]|nr:Rv0340 family protein [Mycobacteriaceae bacterium]MBV9514424.1 Rv0340 family protein [Mycobacteriaceae bacterium]